MTNIDPDEAERRWPALGAAIRAAGYASVYALPLRLREEVIGAMNPFVAPAGCLTAEDVALGQALADIATIGLLQERAIHQKQVVSEQLQGALNSRVAIEQAKGVLAERHNLDMAGAFTALRTHARRTGAPLLGVASRIIDGTLDPATLQHA